MSVALPIPPARRPAESNERSFDLVEMLLDEQNSLTAVQRFSEMHDSGDLDRGDEAPAQAAYYRSLLPATAPMPGQQYSFAVDLDACSGCKACVVACHTMNGLEEDESWRRVGTVTIGDPQPRIQHVTTACHHCADPGCLSGCPVRAYEKDPQTGIVAHLDDQCIGCKYCTMMCPYEVPRYSDRLGIVRKCDMCQQRLRVNEAPACVQSCPNEAISIRIVAADQTAELAPGAPPSTITRPTTLYSRKKGSGAFLAGKPQDAEIDQVAESHWPLAVMLVATQISVGMLLAERLAATLLRAGGSAMPMEVTRMVAVVALVIGMIGLNLAPLHLGQPLRAWRIFLGLKTSWLSREAVLLGKYAAALAVAVALLWLPSLQYGWTESIAGFVPDWAAKATLGLALAIGMGGLFSSGMIYIATRRTLWRYSRTLSRFFGTTFIGGAAWAGAVMIFADSPAAITAITLLTALVLTAIKLDWETRIQLGAARGGDDAYDRRSRRLVHNDLRRLKRIRLASGGAAIVLMVVGLLTMTIASTVAFIVAVAAAVILTLGETCERLLYFSSVVYDRMPGTLR